MKEYEVDVEMTWRFTARVKVRTVSRDRALKTALLVAECDWSNAELVSQEATIVEEPRQ